MSLSPRGPPWIDEARAALEAALTSRHLLPTTALRCWLSWCLASIFFFPATAHHLYGTVKLLQQLIVSKGMPSLARTALASALGELTLQHGAKVVSCSQESVACLAKQLPLRELALREAAVVALVAIVEGTKPALPDAGEQCDHPLPQTKGGNFVFDRSIGAIDLSCISSDNFL